MFSHYERELMKAGTRQVVLGKDSIKNFDDCTICLNPAVSPVCCLKGHIFCKECAYQNILRQKSSRRARPSTTASSCGMAPPESEVPAPRGTTGMPCASASPSGRYAVLSVTTATGELIAPG